MTARWGSSAGTFFTWEPVDFGLHRAEINVAKSLAEQAHWGTALSELDAQVGAASAFIDVVVTRQEVAANQAVVDKLQIFADVVGVLVSKELRAGVDQSLADAALLGARNGLIAAVERERIARAALAEALGMAGTQVEVMPGAILTAPGEFKREVLPELTSHPLALQKQAEIDTVIARYHALTRSYYPHFQILGALWGRGSSYDANGSAGHNGLLLTIPNYGFGLNVIFHSLDIFSIRSRERIQRHSEQAERARYDLVMQTLKFQDEKSKALIEGSIKIAANTPLQLAAAREAELRARTRYKVALASVVEVAQAEQLLAQAEVADAVARADVWRAMLVASAAHGTIKPFLSLAQSNGDMSK
jgi:outer membrane protein TolC